MAYIKANNISGKLSGAFISLTSAGTSAVWSADPGIPTITSPNKMRITVAPGTAQEEIIDITAHTSGATTATVLRNVEATQNGQNSTAAHSAVDWTHAPTANDFLIPGSSAFEDAVRAAVTDDLIDPPAAAKDFNNQRGINLGAGFGGQDIPNLAQLIGNQLPYVVSGCVWTADASGSTLLGSMTAGTVMIKGVLLSVAAITHHTFTASRDTYVDFTDRGDGVATVTFTEVTNNHSSPALAGTNVLDTLRNAIIVSTGSALTTGASTINQGAATAVGTSGATTTVAVTSNGAAVNAGTLNVGANSLASAGFAIVDTNKGAGNFGTLIKYTGGGGTTALTGVTVVAGDVTGTVATGGAVGQIAIWSISDSLGNRIYPTTPYPGIIAGRNNDATASTSTLTSTLIGTVAVPFIIPPGVSRRVKTLLLIPYFGSSAAAGTQLVVASYIDGTQHVGQAIKVKVASDGEGVVQIGEILVSPGSHVMSVSVSQGAAGTLTSGLLFTITKTLVELA